MHIDVTEWADLPMPCGCECPVIRRVGEEFVVTYTDHSRRAVATAEVDVEQLSTWQRDGKPPASIEFTFSDPAELVSATRARLDGLEAERAALEKDGRPRR